MTQREEREAILQKLTEFLPAEDRYRELYMTCPGAFQTPIRDWSELALRLREQGFDGKIPSNAPSPILPWLTEAEWFPEGRLDVSLVRNDRYCPPFWHRLEFIKIVYVIRGGAVLFVNDERIRITEGNLCLVSPGVENASFSAGDDDIVINIIVKKSTFESSFSSLLTETSGLSDFFWQMLYNKNGGEVMLFRRAGNYDLTEYVLQLYRELNLEENRSNIMIKSYLLLFFGLMLRHYENDDRSHKTDHRLAGILQYMNDHKATVTLPALAERFCLSEGYLSRYLRRGTGEPFCALLKRMRVRQAAAMLQNSKCSIEEICYAVGYSDMSRFYRNFKEQYGATPAEFRRTGAV